MIEKMAYSSNSKTIAYLTGEYARAGDTFIRREVEQLRKMGWTVHTFSIRRAAGENVSEDITREQATTVYILEQGIFRLLGAFLIVVCRYPLRVLRALNLIRKIRWPGLRSVFLHGVYLLEATYLARELLKNKVKLLHNHIAMNSGTVAMLAAEIAGIPYSLTVHGPHEFFDSEHWALGTKIEKSVLTVCISNFGKSQCMLFSPRSAWSRLQVVHCALDDVFLKADVTAPPDISRFVYVGRLDPEKGFFVLLEAMAILKQQGFVFELLVVGDGAVRKECEERVEQLQLLDSIKFLGWRSSEEVQGIIKECRVMVLPSFAEGLPVVLMESLALQRPAIATQIAGIPELIQEGVNGWLVPPSAADELAKAMGSALNETPEQLAIMGENGRKHVIEHHSIVTEVAKLAEDFEQGID